MMKRERERASYVIIHKVGSSGMCGNDLLVLVLVLLFSTLLLLSFYREREMDNSIWQLCDMRRFWYGSICVQTTNLCYVQHIHPLFVIHFFFFFLSSNPFPIPFFHISSSLSSIQSTITKTTTTYLLYITTRPLEETIDNSNVTTAKTTGRTRLC